MKQLIIKNIDGFEMWCYRHIFKISWMNRITNVQLLQRLGKICELINEIKIKKLEYLRHIMREEQYELLRNIMQYKIEGKRNVGKRKTSI